MIDDFNIDSMRELRTGIDNCVGAYSRAVWHERERGFASNHEAYAQNKDLLEKGKSYVKQAEKLGDALWEAVTSGNDDSVSVYMGELVRCYANAAALCAQAAGYMSLNVEG